MYITNPTASHDLFSYRGAFVTFYPTLEINQAVENLLQWVVFFNTSSRSGDYFYNGSTTGADPRHNKGNHPLAKVSWEGYVD